MFGFRCRILSGGTASGFRKVDTEVEPKLYKVKGKRTPTLTQQVDISWNYFNSGDVFLIQTPEILFIWIGRGSNAIEKIHGARVRRSERI